MEEHDAQHANPRVAPSSAQALGGGLQRPNNVSLEAPHLVPRFVMQEHGDQSSSAPKARRTVAWGDRREPQVTAQRPVEPAKRPKEVRALGPCPSVNGPCP